MSDQTVGRITQLTHTPGPWQVSPLDGRTCGPSRLLVQSGTTIPQMQAVAIVTLRTNETDANARLIAAAPDLLAESRADEKMLSGLLAALNQATALGATRVDVGDLRIAVEHRLKPLRHVIAKAEGQS